MNQESMFGKVLIAIDGSEDSFKACAAAASLLADAKLSEVTVLYVTRTLSIYAARFADELRAELNAEAERALDVAVPLLQAEAVKVRIEVLASNGSVVRTIVEFAAEAKFDLIILGTRGRGGIEKMLLGSVSSGVAMHASCSVLVVRPPSHPKEGRQQFRRILVAVDGSKSATKAAHVAAYMARIVNGDVTVLHVLELPDLAFSSSSVRLVDKMVRYAGEAAERIVSDAASLAQKEGIPVAQKVIENARSPASGITTQAKEDGVDLVVVGMRGQGGFSTLLLGSVASSVLTHAHCSVLVVR